jgi:quercetin dioxygenase-like cupin family protein
MKVFTNATGAPVTGIGSPTAISAKEGIPTYNTADTLPEQIGGECSEGRSADALRQCLEIRLDENLDGIQMTSDKAKRDALNNERFKDIYIHASQEPWIQFYPGVGFKLLRATQETGHWTVLLNCAKGSSIPRHEHLGAGEYYVISGKMEVRGGVENGGITAITGDYGYEPNGVIHDMTNFPEDTVIYFTNFGPIRYIDDDNNTVGFLDWQGVLKAAEVLMMASHPPLPPPDGR